MYEVGDIDISGAKYTSNENLRDYYRIYYEYFASYVLRHIREHSVARLSVIFTWRLAILGRSCLNKKRQRWEGKW